MALEGVPEMSKPSTKTDAQDRGRFSARRKTEAVLRLLRGEDLDALSRERGIVAATLSGWRDAFLDGGTAAMKSRPADDRDELVARLRVRVGEKCQHLECSRPLGTPGCQIAALLHSRYCR